MNFKFEMVMSVKNREFEALDSESEHALKLNGELADEYAGLLKYVLKVTLFPSVYSYFCSYWFYDLLPCCAQAVHGVTH